MDGCPRKSGARKPRSVALTVNRLYQPLGRLVLRQRADQRAVRLTDVVVLEGLLAHGEDVGVGSAVGLGAVAHPVGLARHARGLAPVGDDGPGATRLARRALEVAPEQATHGQIRRLLAHQLGLDHGRLLVEDAVLLDQVGVGVTDGPDVVARARGVALLVADHRAQRTGESALHAAQIGHVPLDADKDGDVVVQELGDVLGAVQAEGVLLLAGQLADVDDAHVRPFLCKEPNR